MPDPSDIPASGKAQAPAPRLRIGFLLAPRFTVTEALAAFQASLGQAVQHTTLRGRLEKMKQHGWVLDTGDKNQPRMGRPQALLEHRPQQRGGFVFDRSVLS